MSSGAAPKSGSADESVERDLAELDDSTWFGLAGTQAANRNAHKTNNVDFMWVPVKLDCVNKEAGK